MNAKKLMNSEAYISKTKGLFTPKPVKVLDHILTLKDNSKVQMAGACVYEKYTGAYVVTESAFYIAC